MHNIKTIRDNPDYFKKKLADRNVEVNLDSIIKKDKENRELIQKKENLEHEKKIVLIEALWTIIYSDDNADLYEANLMRRLTGLLYLDKKLVGDIKEKIKNKKK